MSEKAKDQARNDKGGTKPMTTKRNKQPKPPNRVKKCYCVLCRGIYLKQEAQEHVHGMQHHQELENVLGKDSFHECQACNVFSTGLHEYALHISTPEHKANLKSLMDRRTKPISLLLSLGKDAMCYVEERNKTLKKEKKKAAKKKKKMLKQTAGQRCIQLFHKTIDQGRNNVVVQNKENKVLQSSLHQTEMSCLSGEPSVRHQSTQSPQQPEFEVFSGKVVGVTENHQNNYYSKQYDAEFTSDSLPYHGAILFGHGQNDSMVPSQPVQAGSAHPASANGSANSAPIREVNVSAMLRQIRRALGVREPCRADREARKQKGEVGVGHITSKPAGAGKKQLAGSSLRKCAKEASLHTTSAAEATPAQSSQVNTPASASMSSVCPSNIVPPGPKQKTLKMTERVTERCKKNSTLVSDSNGQSNGEETQYQGVLDSQTSLSRPTIALEPNLSAGRKVRIAHKSARVQGGKAAEFRPTVNKLVSLSATKNKPQWLEMYKERKAIKQRRAKGMPRFGIEFANPLSGKDSSTQAMDFGIGFQWESGSPSVAHLTKLPPLPQNAILNDSRTETQSVCQAQEPLEQLGAAQERCSRQPAETASVKVKLKDDKDLGSNCRVTKRKRNTCDGTDKEPRGLNKKTKSNQELGQMDQLLAVSLREDELSHSLQDLDNSLIQARTVLQAAYAEVQRLLLVKQQITAEVNSLRTQRIGILQGMKGGYTGAEKASTSSAGALATVQHAPSSSTSPTSLSKPPSNAKPAPSISPIVLPTMPVKHEIPNLSISGQAGQFAKTVSCNSETPAKQSVPILPSDLLPLPLLPSPRLAAPTTAVTLLKQPKTECSTSPSKSLLTESLARQQTIMVLSDSDEDIAGKPCMEQVKEVKSNNKSKEEAANMLVSTVEKVSAAPPGEDGGSKSDVEVIEPLKMVIAIDESDSEDAANVLFQQERSPKESVSVESVSLSPQASQPNDAVRNVQPSPVCVPECVNLVEDEEPTVGAFSKHAGSVLGLHLHEGRLYTCSADNTARAFDLKLQMSVQVQLVANKYELKQDFTRFKHVTRECQAVFEGHTNKVNCLLVSSQPSKLARLFTGSSDQTIRCYSIQTTKCLEQISLADRVLCLHMAWNILYAGLAKGAVSSYDLETLKHLEVFDCHGPRGVSCLGTAQEGARRVLLVGSYDSTISVRDAKSGLLLRTLEGHSKTVLCMKVVNDLVFSGSSDTSVHAHNIHTGELVRIYKGHNHAITSIVILGKVMVTACLDQLVRVYELQSHDRLQVYGGHSDMLMCMDVHKSVIYTGCHDGSIQAVKLNLMKNYRCWWHNCSLIFGMTEHLVEHLVRHHSNPNMQAVKCRWRNCSSFFGTRNSVQQKLPEHMQSHVDNEGEVPP